MKRSKIFCEVCEVMRPAPTVYKESSVKEALAMLKKKSKLYDSIDYIYIIEKDGTLIGVFSIKELFRFSPETPVGKFMTKDVISVHPKTQSETVADIAIKHGIKSVPVVELGKIIGVIPPRILSKILSDSLRKDIFHFAGIHKSHLEYENTLEVPLGKSVKHRIPWLIIGLCGIMLTAVAIGAFENILKKYIILAFFIPAIAYICAAVGTQIQTLFVRDLAVLGEKLKIHLYLIKQISISFVIAALISVIMFGSIAIFWKQPYIGFAISIATFASIIITSLTAFSITYSLKKSGKDPAIGGGPFATAVSDAISIIVYFTVATIML